MTLRSELPPIDDKMHRIHYQHHHHHYHVHHLIQHQFHNHNLHQHTHGHRTCLHTTNTNVDHRDHNGHISKTNFDLVKPDEASLKAKVIAQTGARGVAQKATSTHRPAIPSYRSSQKSQIQFILFAALTYVLSPIDLIPEVIFGVIGILDDLLFLIMCMFCVAIILIYPIFRDMQRSITYKLGLKQIIFSIQQ